jgi:type II secretory pathway component PulK
MHPLLQSPSRSQRRAYALLIVLILLAVVFVGVGLLVQRLAMQQRGTKELARRLQAQSLAEAGLDRAFAKLTTDRNFAGETWQPQVAGHAAAAELARVDIRVQPSDEAGIVKISVTALFPDHPTRRAQVVLSRPIRLPATD